MFCFALSNKPSKLTFERILNFIIYMKHDNVIVYATFMWNWLKYTLCDDAIFIASCVNHALEDEIRWPTPKVRLSLCVHLQEISRCIGFINGILIKIHKP
jgi:hypothetical protein